MQQKCGMLINNVNNVKMWFYEKNYEYFIVAKSFISCKSIVYTIFTTTIH